VKKTGGGFHNGPNAEVIGAKRFATRQVTIVKEMCDTPSTFHNAPLESSSKSYPIPDAPFVPAKVLVLIRR
jgi:hypothetical protein